MFHGVLFGLLLVLIAVLLVRVCLARAVNMDGKQLGHRVIGLGTNAGSWPVDAPTVSIIITYWDILQSIPLFCGTDEPRYQSESLIQWTSHLPPHFGD